MHSSPPSPPPQSLNVLRYQALRPRKTEGLIQTLAGKSQTKDTIRSQTQGQQLHYRQQHSPTWDIKATFVFPSACCFPLPQPGGREQAQLTTPAPLPPAQKALPSLLSSLPEHTKVQRSLSPLEGSCESQAHPNTCPCPLPGPLLCPKSLSFARATLTEGSGGTKCRTEAPAAKLLSCRGEQRGMK